MAEEPEMIDSREVIEKRISPRHAIDEFAKVLWHLRSLLLVLFLLFSLLVAVMR